MGPTTDGILLVDKKEGETSFEVVRKVKNAFGNIKGFKVGHAGTLDPFASGLLIILLGQGTKLSRFLVAEKKLYRATMVLGVETDTLDHTGRVVQSCPVSQMDIEYVREKARCFVGDISQTPPQFSAVKYKGERAYSLARRGIKVKLEQKVVTIYGLNILYLKIPEIIMEVECSGGTYIRSLAADLGTKLGTVAHLNKLRRLSCGTFQIEDSIASSELSRFSSDKLLKERVIPLQAALPDVTEIETDDAISEMIFQGYRPRLSELVNETDLSRHQSSPIKIVNNDRLVAIAHVEWSLLKVNERIKLIRVFSR